MSLSRWQRDDLPLELVEWGEAILSRCDLLLEQCRTVVKQNHAISIDRAPMKSAKVVTAAEVLARPRR